MRGMTLGVREQRSQQIDSHLGDSSVICGGGRGEPRSLSGPPLELPRSKWGGQGAGLRLHL